MCDFLCLEFAGCLKQVSFMQMDDGFYYAPRQSSKGRRESRQMNGAIRKLINYSETRITRRANHHTGNVLMKAGGKRSSCFHSSTLKLIVLPFGNGGQNIDKARIVRNNQPLHCF